MFDHPRNREDFKEQAFTNANREKSEFFNF